MTEKRIDQMTLADYKRAFENMERKKHPEPMLEFMVINDAGMVAICEQCWIASSKEVALLSGVRFPRV